MTPDQAQVQQLIERITKEVMVALQTQSAGVYSLIGELPALRQLGIASLRLSPQSRHMGRVVDAFQAALAGEQTAADVLARIMPGPAVDGYWHGRAGLENSLEQHA